MMAYIIAQPFIFAAQRPAVVRRFMMGLRLRSTSLRGAAKMGHFLKDQEMCAHFFRFLQAEYSAENLLFIQQVKAFRIQYLGAEANRKDLPEFLKVFSAVPEDKTSMQNAAIEIYDRFISSHAVMQVNLPARIKRPLDPIFTPGFEDKISEDVFDLAGTCIWNLMNSDSWPRFCVFQERELTQVGTLEVVSSSRETPTAMGRTTSVDV